MRLRSGTILLLVLLLTVLPLALPSPAGPEEPFSGADARAEALITRLRPDYTPWFRPLWEPPSGEIESLLFALQASLGAGLIGYYLGFARGRNLSAGGTRERVHD